MVSQETGEIPMKIGIAAFSLAMMAGACTAMAPANEMSAADVTGLSSIVKLDSGYVSGLNGPVRVYKGIPFAAPPVGPLRWKSAQPIAPWEGVKTAVSFGPECVSGRGVTPTASEDCLTLNVWTPAKATGAKLPVMVWIHGGAYEGGSGIMPLFDGTALASQGIVVVTINYRLGMLGFFSHPELSAESPDHVSGNQAVTDMIQSLKWVQANIGGFGGDKDNVTIMGESAGGTSMGLLLLSPKANGMFHKAVASSPWGFLHPSTHVKKTWYGRKPAEEAGAALGSLADLRAKSVADVVAVPRTPMASPTLHQVVDGVIIPDDPTILWREGKINRAKLIVGTNRDEGTIFTQSVTTLEEAKKRVSNSVGPDSDGLLAVYGATTDAGAEAANFNIMRDSWFSVGARQMARSADMASDVWQYEFTRVNGAGVRGKVGAFHTAEIPYFLRNLPAAPYIANRTGPLQLSDFTVIDETLSVGMSNYLLNFIKTGDPNGAGLKAWPKFGDGGESYMEFGENGFTVKADLRKKELDAVEALFLDRLAKR